MCERDLEKKNKIECVWFDQAGVECILDPIEKKIKVTGPLGSIEQVFKGDEVVFAGDDSVKIKSKSSLGYFISRLKNFFEGVTEGYFIELEITGRGYRFMHLTEQLLVKLGFMHYNAVEARPGVKIFGSRNRLVIFGLDLEEVNGLASTIRQFQVPDAYKGKGIRYMDEKITLKVGKKS